MKNYFFGHVQNLFLTSAIHDPFNITQLHCIEFSCFHNPRIGERESRNLKGNLGKCNLGIERHKQSYDNKCNYVSKFLSTRSIIRFLPII